MSVRSFQELEVWKLGISIAEEVYRFTSQFPKQETYGLISQMRRASVSVPSNIAEGFNRWNKGDFKHFLDYAIGSCGELATQVILSVRLGFINQPDAEKLLNIIGKEQALLKNFISRLKQS